MAKVESFDGLISSIQDAFLSVNKMAERQHIDTLQQFLEEDGSPKTIRVKYPCFAEDGNVDYRFVEVPELCLVPISALKLSEVSVDFKVKLSAEINLNKEETEELVAGKESAPLPSAPSEKSSDASKKNKIGFIPAFRQKQDNSFANVTLKFNAEDPPEGILRLRDEMIKILP